MGGYLAPEKKKDESQLSKLTKDSTKTTIEQVHGLMAQVMKDILFNINKSETSSSSSSSQ
jgi:COP9 signalosome complex subunit 5